MKYYQFNYEGKYVRNGGSFYKDSLILECPNEEDGAKMLIVGIVRHGRILRDVKSLRILSCREVDGEDYQLQELLRELASAEKERITRLNKILSETVTLGL